MALLPALYRKKLIFLTLLAALILIKNTEALPPEENANKSENNNKATILNHTQSERQQKTFKKDLKVNVTGLNLEPVTIPPEGNDHTEKLVIIDEKSVIETAGKVGEQQIIEAHQTPVAVIEKSDILMVSPTHSLPDTEQKNYHHEEDVFLIKGDDDISDSLKTGFYFFLIMSSGAILFITFKIYRLRLSRAERKYGVQGDRTTQELTPLPISIEDGHSDDEDQTLFEVQRQNIRIL